MDLLRQGFFTPQEPILQPGIDDVPLQTYQDLLDLARGTDRISAGCRREGL